MNGGPSSNEQSSQLRRTDPKAVEPLRLLNCITAKTSWEITKLFQKMTEIAIDFAGPFQNAINARKYLLASIDHLLGLMKAKFLSKPQTENVIEF